MDDARYTVGVNEDDHYCNDNLGVGEAVQEVRVEAEVVQEDLGILGAL